MCVPCTDNGNRNQTWYDGPFLDSAPKGHGGVYEVDPLAFGADIDDHETHRVACRVTGSRSANVLIVVAKISKSITLPVRQRTRGPRWQR